MLKINIASLALDAMTVLWPVIILGGMSAVFAILLAVLGKKLAVERDEKIDLVASELCGANCGACGFAGCDAFAVALVEDSADLSSCNATDMEHKDKIAVILGVDNSAAPTMIRVACNGGLACRDKFQYQGFKDCASATIVSGGAKECSSACLGLGTCVSVCPSNAIEIDDKGMARIITEKCTTCGLCINSCPKSIIQRIPADAKVFVACSNHDKGKKVKDACSNGCIACGLCARFCEAGAITMVNNLPVIDYSKCTGCMKCVAKCPMKCIHQL